MSASGDVLLSSFPNIEGKRKAFEEPFTGKRLEETHPKIKFLCLPARRHVPFAKM